MNPAPASLNPTGTSFVTYAARSSIGMVRSENQDSFGIFLEDKAKNSDRKGMLFVVADGMGGQSGGKEASSTAVNVLQHTFFSTNTDDILASLKESFIAANTAIFEKSQHEVLLKGMGTTCTAIVILDDAAHTGHIGDSRAYRIDERGAIQLTEDHSGVADRVRNGLISDNELRTHPERSLITRALGIAPQVEVDFHKYSIERRESCYVLCSDGLWGTLDDTEIQSVVWSHSPQDACDRLVERANEEGGLDNATAIVIRVRSKGKFLGGLLNRILL